MIHYIEGRLMEKSPAHAVIDCHGVGYYINITGNTYSKIGHSENCRLLTHVITNQQDYSQHMYGFADEHERDTFRHLISVNGVGASTARMILSAMSPAEVQSTVSKGDVASFRRIKGIGEKTAQRIILDLSGKLSPAALLAGKSSGIPQNNKIKEEALMALQALGFSRNNSEKAIERALAGSENLPVEQVVKEALRNL